MWFLSVLKTLNVFAISPKQLEIKLPNFEWGITYVVAIGFAY